MGSSPNLCKLLPFAFPPLWLSMPVLAFKPTPPLSLRMVPRADSVACRLHMYRIPTPTPTPLQAPLGSLLQMEEVSFGKRGNASLGPGVLCSLMPKVQREGAPVPSPVGWMLLQFGLCILGCMHAPGGAVFEGLRKWQGRPSSRQNWAGNTHGSRMGAHVFHLCGHLFLFAVHCHLLCWILERQIRKGPGKQKYMHATVDSTPAHACEPDR